MDAGSMGQGRTIRHATMESLCFEIEGTSWRHGQAHPITNEQQRSNFDSHPAPEFIAERFSARFANLSPKAQARVVAGRRGLQGRVITPEFGHHWKLRPCRDISHMAWNQVAHFSQRLTLHEQIVGDAGGGVIKHVGS